jgi:16S rRNA (guanine966-N2)-methyltransferase
MKAPGGGQTCVSPAILRGMRVISGEHRGRRLATPDGMATRPITDRVKASLFDWLGSMLAMPGRLPPIHVCDIFCGGGSQGIESLSRGAASCVFVERDADALRCLRENLDRLRITEPVTIVGARAESITVGPSGGGEFGLIFVDPPYRLSEDVTETSAAGLLSARLGEQIPTLPDALVLWRHDDTCHLPDPMPGGWRVAERRSWGGMAISLLNRPARETP